MVTGKFKLSNTYLVGHILDLDIFPSGVNVTDLDEPGSARVNTRLLGHRGFHSQPLSFWFTCLSPGAMALLTGSWRQVQPEERSDEFLVVTIITRITSLIFHI